MADTTPSDSAPQQQGDPAPQTPSTAPAPATPHQPSDSAPTPQSDSAPTPNDLQAQLDAARAELARKTADLQRAQRESTERRKELGQLKTVEEQYAEAHATNAELRRELDEVRRKLETYTGAEETERAALLEQMTTEDRDLYGDLPLAKLRILHQKLYTGKAPERSQGDSTPPATDAELPIEAQLEAALAAGDNKKFNELFTKAKGG